MSYATPRTDAKPRELPAPIGIAAAVIFFALVLWLVGHALGNAQTQADAEPTITHSSLAPTYTHDGEIIRWYVLVDPDTDVEYLVNDRGGCCPRLDANGDVMGTLTERGV